MEYISVCLGIREKDLIERLGLVTATDLFHAKDVLIELSTGEQITLRKPAKGLLDTLAKYISQADILRGSLLIKPSEELSEDSLKRAEQSREFLRSAGQWELKKLQDRDKRERDLDNFIDDPEHWGSMHGRNS